MSTVGEILHDTLLPRLHGVRQQSGSFIARCPAHEDNNPSLSITPGKTQPVVLRCHAGCDTEAILAALELTWQDISADREDTRHDADEWTPAGPASDVYDYRDETGQLLFQVLRVPQPGGKKTFRQRVPDPASKSGWRWKLDDTRRVLYRLPELTAAVEAGQPVYLVEGEKDVHALVRAGVAATCNSGGAGKWRPEYDAWFVDADVVIVADRDKPGQAHAREVADALTGVAGSLRIVEPAAGKDAADHLAAGKSVDEFVTTWSEQQHAPIDLAPDLFEFLSVVDPPTVWVVPGLLERGDRLIWTGTEGLGKSLCVRMIAVAAAAGIHPFTGETFDPARVLYIDCENSERQGRRHFRNLERVARGKRRPVPDQGMFVIHRPAGIDLSRLEDAAWLMERVTAHKPDLLVCGPFYRLHAGDSEEESAARKVVAALDAARVAADCALIVEHHAPHGHNGTRQLRPFGSSLLMRWPEMGMGIAPMSEETPCRHVAVKAWRGNRDERHWPRALRWGTGELDWPWVIDESSAKDWG
ncbi:AAA family ATPase [Pseudonocardia alni]|uniref:AAA family ATPase n=1 Tax=Pseudonocardia alni TaxID=33907 RepID=UPI0033308099